MIGARVTDPRTVRGFTLIEVLLAMLLSTALLAGLWAALEISLRMFETGRTKVEEAQLTRALLSQLNNDLQQAVIESSLAAGGEVLAPLTPLPGVGGVASQGSANPSSANQPAPTQSAGGFGQSSSARPQTSVAGILPLSRGGNGGAFFGNGSFGARGSQEPPRRKPGLSGTAHELRVDLCRVISPEVAAPRNRDLTAAETRELRTVFYLLARPLPAESPAFGAPANSGEALIRCETSWLDSPTEEQGAKPAGMQATSQDLLFEEFLALEDRYESSQQASIEGAAPALSSDDFAISPEVAGLEFRYFDGVEWLSSWDSEAAGRLPLAVEIVLAVRPMLTQRDARIKAASEAEAGQSTLPERIPTARLVVQLPLGSNPASSAPSASSPASSSAGESFGSPMGSSPPAASSTPSGAGFGGGMR